MWVHWQAEKRARIEPVEISNEVIDFVREMVEPPLHAISPLPPTPNRDVEMVPEQWIEDFVQEMAAPPPLAVSLLPPTPNRDVEMVPEQLIEEEEGTHWEYIKDEKDVFEAMSYTMHNALINWSKVVKEVTLSPSPASVACIPRTFQHASARGEESTRITLQSPLAAARDTAAEAPQQQQQQQQSIASSPRPACSNWSSQGGGLTSGSGCTSPHNLQHQQQQPQKRCCKVAVPRRVPAPSRSAASSTGWSSIVSDSNSLSSSNSVPMASGSSLPRPADNNVGHQVPGVMTPLEYSVVATAFKGPISFTRIENTAGEHRDIDGFLQSCYPVAEADILKAISEPRHPTIKASMVLCCELTHAPKGSEGTEETSMHYIWGDSGEITRSTSIAEWFQESTLSVIMNRFSKMEVNGSALALSQLLHLDLHSHVFDPLKGGSSFIKLPVDIANKKACINVDNRPQKTPKGKLTYKGDNFCFAWSVLACETKCIF